MTALIPDPQHPHLRAIDPRDGSLMGGVFLVPTEGMADHTAPTAAELDAATRPKLHIGYAHPTRPTTQEDPA